MHYNRRVAAEGLSIVALMRAIKAASEAAKTGGVDTPLTQHTSSELADDIIGSTSYGGGYMYSGDIWSLDGRSLVLMYTRHFVREYDLEQYPKLPVQQLLDEAPVGATLLYEGRRAEYSEFIYVKAHGGAWVLKRSFSEMQREWEEGLYLFPGIRAEVASALNVGVSSTFNEAFDEAVVRLTEM